MGAQIPATPVGDQLSWILERLLRGRATEKEAIEHFEAEFLARFPVATILSIGGRAVSLLGDVVVVDVDAEDGLQATMTVGGATGLRALVRAAVGPLAPHRLSNLGFTPAPPATPPAQSIYDVIVLNGVSSSGKSTLARALQATLEPAWLHAELDTFLRMLPMKGLAEAVTVARGANAAVAALVREGNRVIYDCSFDQQLIDDLRAELADAKPLFVGVHCAPDVLAARERERGDRMIGQARAQLTAAHVGASYDLEVDTTNTSPDVCARQVADALLRQG